MDKKEKILNAREFCEKVKVLEKEYKFSFQFLQSVSVISNNGCEDVKNVGIII